MSRFVAKSWPLLGAVRNVLFGLAVVAVCAAFVGVGVAIKRTDKPILKQTPPHSFVWSDRIPLSEKMLSQWLAKRGAKYRAWAKAHPAAAKRLLQAQPAESPPLDEARLAGFPVTATSPVPRETRHLRGTAPGRASRRL